ncbi:hypothetical protein PATA110616_22845 [Paenibacillus tarimensis]
MVHVEHQQITFGCQLYELRPQQRRLRQIERPDEGLHDSGRFFLTRMTVLDGKVDALVNALYRFALYDLKTGSQRFVPCD